MPLKSQKYADKQLIKHAPPRKYRQSEVHNCIYIKSSTPFISAVKRIEKCLRGFKLTSNKRGKGVTNFGMRKPYVIVRGMGKAINKVVNLGVYFKYEKKAQVQIFTKTIGVLDQFVPKEADSSDVLRKRNVGSIEIRILAVVNDIGSL